MADNFLKKISEIKNRMKSLKISLREIPKSRELNNTIEEFQNNSPAWIYKPRFKLKESPIPQEIKTELIQIIDEINLYLRKSSPDNFNLLKDIIDLTSENKNSIVFLLEKDVYQTNRVYGDYLVEKYQDYFEINYLRWNEKKKKLPNQALSIDLEKFIKEDALAQVQNRFEELWNVLENEIGRCENHYNSKKALKNDIKLNLIKNLLSSKESEYLDFKIAMYDIFNPTHRSKLEQRKEFLKDVLALINNRTFDNNDGKAYIIIGIGEKEDLYNGTHRNIEYKDYNTLISLTNGYIAPKVIMNFIVFYISGDEKNIKISEVKKKEYHRNLIIKLSYKIGTVYEIYKKYGNPNEGVEHYYEGTSFTRDDSFTRRLLQEDRERITGLFKEILRDDYGLEDYDEFDDYDEYEYISNREVTTGTSKIKIDIELIEKYLEMLHTKELSSNTIDNILNTIRHQTTRLEFRDSNIIDESDLQIISNLVKYCCLFLQGKSKNTNRTIFIILDSLTRIPEITEVIKNNCFKTLMILFNEGERYSNFIEILNVCGRFKNLIDEIIIAIHKKDILLLEKFRNFEITDPTIISNKWSIIPQLIEIKENLNEKDDSRIIYLIQEIIHKFERL